MISKIIMPKKFEPTILLLGCGYTLTRVLKRLPLNSVVYTTQTGESLERAGDFVSRRYHGQVLDLNSPSGVRDLFDEYPTIDTIVDSIPPRAAPGSDDALAGVNNLCSVLSTRTVKKLIYLSSTGVYGVNDGSEVNESTPCNPVSVKGFNRMDCEEAYSKATANFTALRISGIYGPGRGLGNALKKGTYKVVAGATDRWSNHIHVDDLVSAILLAIKFPAILPKILCVSDDTPSLIKEVVDYYCTTFKLPPPGTISQEEALKSEAYTSLSNQKVSNAMIKKELGLKLKYPSYKEGAATEFA